MVVKLTQRYFKDILIIEKDMKSHWTNGR